MVEWGRSFINTFGKFTGFAVCCPGVKTKRKEGSSSKKCQRLDSRRRGLTGVNFFLFFCTFWTRRWAFSFRIIWE